MAQFGRVTKAIGLDQIHLICFLCVCVCVCVCVFVFVRVRAHACREQKSMPCVLLNSKFVLFF